MVDPVVLETVPLTGSPWPTIDPFLFCVHHDDAYPAGNGHFGPDAPLDRAGAGRRLRGRRRLADVPRARGARVPAASAPRVRDRHLRARGLIDHSDSLGAAARFGAGDTQWLTAGRGIVHSEMFPLLDDDAPNPLELFQIWLNLPAESKLAEPYFSMLWARDIPVVTVRDDDGRATTVTVVAGELDEPRAAGAAARLVGVASPTPTSPSGTSRSNRARRGRSPRRRGGDDRRACSTCTRAPSRVGGTTVERADRRGRARRRRRADRRPGRERRRGADAPGPSDR